MDINPTLRNTQTQPRDAILVAAVNPDGSPLGVLACRQVFTRNGVTVVGQVEVAPSDTNRLGMTFRNDSDAKMYLRTDGPAGDGVGYPIDPGRGYSFEGTGMLPSGAISVWCATAGKRWAMFYATKGAQYA